MNDVIQCLCSRRSVRKYKSVQVEENSLQQILQAAIFAPTGRGLQSPVIVVVQDKQTISHLSKLNAAILGVEHDPFYGAPTVVIVFADKTCHTYVEDGSLVLGNLMNAAYAVGVDSCWIHRAKEVFSMNEGKKLMQKWGLSENLVGIGHCILGYHDGEYPSPKERKKGYIVSV